MSEDTAPIKDSDKPTKKKSRFITFIKQGLKSFKKLLRKLIEKFKKLRKPWKIGLSVFFVIVIAVIAFFIIKAIITPFSADEQIRKMAEQYFEEKIEPANSRSTSYTLKLDNMQKVGYDVSSFEDVGCSLESYAVIYISNPKESNPKKLNYTIDTKLIGCE